MQHDYYINETSAARVKNVDYDNDMNENIISHCYISYMVNERLQGEEQFHSKNYASLPCQNPFEKTATKTELYNGKSYSKMLHT